MSIREFYRFVLLFHMGSIKLREENRYENSGLKIGNPYRLAAHFLAEQSERSAVPVENFQPVDGEEVLGKIRRFELSSWNFIGHDPKKFRHYGSMAQDFYAAFGHDGIGQIGSETTINSGDMAGILMIAVQALEKRTAELKQKEAQLAVLQSEVKDLKAKHAYFETVAARLEALGLRKNPSVQITADVMP
jgi:hypothetical protein